MINEKWTIHNKKADFYGLAEQLKVDPVIIKMMRNRDLTDAEQMRKYLYGSMQDLYDPGKLPDAEKAADVLAEKIRDKKKIRIISDYDVDGISANYILYRGLTGLGAQVDYKIPDRVEDGYGINVHLIDAAVADGIDTIVTCDNGIAAAKEIACGIEAGMTFVITDHHEVPFELVEGEKRYLLPTASAIVDPKRADHAYPFSDICGAVVAWKLMQLMYQKAGRHLPEELLEMAALATTCDVMPLVDENRIILKEGLARMQRTQIPGLQELFRVNGLTEENGLPKEITAYHLGFVIGPCINASGRLSTANDALQLLLTETVSERKMLAEKLFSLNRERKNMTQSAVETAINLVEEKRKQGIEPDKVLVIYLSEIHESIAGIVAGRVREYYNRPTFILTDSGDCLKGSGRSIDAFHMQEAMSRIGDCFIKFGGHALAAGLSLEADKLEEFRARINEVAELSEEDLVRKTVIDVALPLGYLTEPLVEMLQVMRPFGMKNEKPVFALKNLWMQEFRFLGQEDKVVKLTLVDPENHRVTGISFEGREHFERHLEHDLGQETAQDVLAGRQGCSVDLVYYPEINEYRGYRNLQLQIRGWRFHQ